MQVKTLLILAILPMLFISAYADPDTHEIKTADTDLTSPGCLETEVGCYTPNIMIVDTGHIVTMTNTDESGIHTFTSGTVDGFTATPDGTFDSGILVTGESFHWTPNISGEFPYYCMLHTWMQGVLTVEGGGIIVQTNKLAYNKIETIQITGQINEIIVSPTDQIAITIYDQNDSILIPESLIPITDNTFSHDIITDDIVWNDYTGNVKIIAQLQEYTSEKIIYYSSYPAELSIEYLHDMVSDNTVMINDQYSSHESFETQNTQQNLSITSLTNTITLLQAQVTELHLILEELTDAPIPLPANPPIITSLVADGFNDEYTGWSVGDTITITFDSDTNMPGGIGLQTKENVNNLFTFTELLGQAYRGEWTTPDTFTINVIGLRNAGPPLIGITTVTPTGITPILAVDDTSEPSIVTSPVLTGSFGIS